MLLAELHDVDRGGVDRDVDDHAAARPAGEQRGQHLAVVLPWSGRLDEAELRSSSSLRSLSSGSITTNCDWSNSNMALDQRQGAVADRAEADHHDGAVEAGVNGVVGHRSLLQAEGAHIRQRVTDGIPPRGQAARRPRECVVDQSAFQTDLADDLASTCHSPTGRNVRVVRRSAGWARSRAGRRLS